MKEMVAGLEQPGRRQERLNGRENDSARHKGASNKKHKGTKLEFEQQLFVSQVATVKKVLEELKLRVFEVTDEKATLDGSDVFFTGREFFVGISKWTNHKGAEYVAEAFKDFTVSIVHVPEPHHLKSFCSMGGPSTIIIGNSEVAQKAIKAMEQLTDYQYDKLSVPDDAAANCIYARVGNKCNALVHRTADEFPESSKAFKKLPDYTLIPASCTEVAKLGASLSSCSILINKKFEY
ncbi:hypothetical protein chiPu_0012140 [Chiloscyllium punctatum]|uniref:Uncharacterized protein n=1 Tax=Chiloscyllium punctatum TaxID=137246 RepID=A0A401STE1_CHIPU|nr:hypothetical protein [Chiloscyllium punctatum]